MSFVIRGLVGAATVAYPALLQAQSTPVPEPSSVSTPPLHVYMRSEGAPLTFSARTESGHFPAQWCVSPCDARLAPGNYRLELNGTTVDGTLSLQRTGTLHGEYRSRAGARSAAWLALNVGGIIGGVFLTVAGINGASSAYAASGASLAGASAIFLLVYRTDRASVSFTPDPPLDVRGMDPSASLAGSGKLSSERASVCSTRPGLGLRIAF